MTERKDAHPRAYELDPFRCLPGAAGRLSGRSPRFALVLAPAFVGLALGAAALHGRVGDSSDLQLGDDVLRVLHPPAAPPSTTDFPLLRDAPSAILLLGIVATVYIVWKQWLYFRQCFPQLVNGGVLSPAKRPSFDAPIQRLLRTERFTDPLESETRLERLFERVNAFYSKLGTSLSIFPVLFAILLAAFVVLGESQSSLFRVLAPEGVDPVIWSEETYDSWWAGTHNVWGVLAYGAIASFAIYVVLLQNVVGLTLIYGLVSLESVAEMKLDFLASDDHDGWSPMVRAYRTVRWSLVVNGLLLSFLVMILGVEFKWIMILVGLWCVVAPIYIGVPIHVFGRMARRSGRIESQRIRASAAADPHPTLRDYYLRAWARDEMRALASRRLNPLRSDRWVLPPLIVAAVLPIVLTAAQIVVPLRFGPSAGADTAVVAEVDPP